MQNEWWIAKLVATTFSYICAVALCGGSSYPTLWKLVCQHHIMEAIGYRNLDRSKGIQHR
jgi:hypothetical protein